MRYINKIYLRQYVMINQVVTRNRAILIIPCLKCGIFELSKNKFGDKIEKPLNY